MVKDNQQLKTIVSEILGKTTVARINSAWVKANEKHFGYTRKDVLKVFDELGYKKKFVELRYENEFDRKSVLVAYVKEPINLRDKPLIIKNYSVEELHELYADQFVKELVDISINHQELIDIEILQDTPFFQVAKDSDGEVSLYITREYIRHLVTKLWYNKGKCTKQGINFIVKHIELNSVTAYKRKYTYFKTESGEQRSRNQDKLIYIYKVK